MSNTHDCLNVDFEIKEVIWYEEIGEDIGTMTIILSSGEEMELSIWYDDVEPYVCVPKSEEEMLDPDDEYEVYLVSDLIKH